MYIGIGTLKNKFIFFEDAQLYYTHKKNEQFS